MTAKEWLGVMQKAQDFPKGMERLIEKYGEMLLKEQMQVNKNCVLPDVSNCNYKEKYEKCIKVITRFDAGIIGMYDL